MEFDITDDRGIVTVTFSTGKNVGMDVVFGFRDLAKSLTKLAKHPGLRAVVLKGEDGSVGVNTDPSGPEEFTRSPDWEDNVRDIIRTCINPAKAAIADLPVPVVSVVDGPVVGGGVAVVLTADFIIATQRTSFLLPFEARNQDMAKAATGWRLPKLMAHLGKMSGPATNRELSANDARDIGIVTKIVPTGDLDTALASLVDRVVSGSAEAIVAARRIIDETMTANFDELIDAGAHFEGAADTGGDYRRSLAAYLKRNIELNVQTVH